MLSDDMMKIDFPFSPLSCVFEYNDPDDYFDVSNHEVDRPDDLEYEVRDLMLFREIPQDALKHIFIASTTVVKDFCSSP